MLDFDFSKIDFIGQTDNGYVIKWSDGLITWVPANGGSGNDRGAIEAFTAEGLTFAQPLGIRVDGLTVHLDAGLYWSGSQTNEVLTADSFTFTSPETDTAIAVDVIKNDQGVIELQVYEWDPDTEVKADPDPADTVILADVVRGVLTAGAENLDNLEDE